MDERPITTRGFDMEEGEIFRLFRFYALNRVLPLGCFAELTRFRQLAILTALHQLGRFLFARLIPYEAPLTRLYARLRKKRQTRPQRLPTGV